MRASFLVRVSVVGSSLAAAMALGSAGPLAAQQSASPDSVRAVAAVGVGPTSEAATQAALRSAVEQGVGVFVTSQTRVENDRLIQDRILSMSTGFVRSFQVVETRQGPSGVEVRLLAEVGLTPLREALQAAGVRVQLSGRTLFAAMEQEDEKRLQEVAVLAALFWEDVDQPSGWDFRVATEAPVRREGWFEVPLTVSATPNRNTVDIQSGMLRALYRVAGGGNIVPGRLRSVPVSRSVRAFHEAHRIPYEFDVFHTLPCERREGQNPFQCLISSVSEDATGPVVTEAEFPDAPYRGGYLLQVQRAESTLVSVLLRTQASATILSNYLNQTVFYPGYTLVVEREAGPPVRFTRDATRDFCRGTGSDFQVRLSGNFSRARAFGDIPVLVDAEDAQIRTVQFRRELDYPRLSRGYQILVLREETTLVRGIGELPRPQVSHLTLWVPESFIRQMTGIRIEPTRTRLINGTRLIDDMRGITVPLFQSHDVQPLEAWPETEFLVAWERALSPECRALRAGALQ